MPTEFCLALQVHILVQMLVGFHRQVDIAILQTKLKPYRRKYFLRSYLVNFFFSLFLIILFGLPLGNYSVASHRWPCA